ncbi:WbqC-like protein family protein [Salinivirga cyanobacteriivorans]|uniref:WbqC-like protein family protein n=1 Tax=Salinivirga cyanobacteriivorans TaxID=1307839 RepID=A0A0S2HZW3_9BACT|nr:WbqC family protein [Salinivirga cyanobacteriivorans]ALO15610.1 WbqC-like protein family protein [Salinivirga cyanobacteriivorans]
MKNKRIAILQSNYIPWKGYFDIINSVDEFVMFDTEQFTRRDWRNRNKIKTNNGVQWLTIPVDTKGKYYQSINQTKVIDQKWRIKHWKALVHNYSNAKFFKDYEPLLKPLYLDSNEQYLSRINYSFIKLISGLLGISTTFSWSSDYEIVGERNEKLINICKQAKANYYLSGPSAKNYIDVDLFEKEGVRVEWVNYDNYPEYSQLFPPFNHFVSVLDLFFNEGNNSKNYMKSF